MERSTSGPVDAPAPDARPDSERTGELGAEGGSFGDLTQSERMRRGESASAPDAPRSGEGWAGRIGWWLLGLSLIALLLWFSIHSRAL